MEDHEISIPEGREMAGKGKEFYVFINNLGDLEIVREVLDAKDRVRDIDMGEARTIMFRHGDKSTLEAYAKKFEGCVIVCPHGRTSLEFARALSELGVKAYSLHGGIEALRKA